LFPKNPPYGIGNIAFARTVGPDYGYKAIPEFNLGPFGKRFKSRKLNSA
jgi:hypothetical protein